MLTFIIFASAWNLLACWAGVAGHAAFFGIGTSTLIATQSVYPSSPSLSGGRSSIHRVLIGLNVQLKEWFLAMVTFGFAIIVQTLTVSVLAPLTGGWDGIASPRLVSPSIPGYQLIEYYAILVITIASIATIWYIMKSRIGLAFLAIRENELEARAAGIDPVRYRLLAFALSAYLAGVAGALMIHHIVFVRSLSEIRSGGYLCHPRGLGTLLGGGRNNRAYHYWEGLKAAASLEHNCRRYAHFAIIFLPGLVSLRRQVQEW
jgi:branched-chain amino acid transport system permease protein